LADECKRLATLSAAVGDDIHTQATTGHDALAFARRAGNHKAIAWLLSAGGDRSPQKSPV
jgi:diacylglycerol kinase family enzyme